MTALRAYWRRTCRPLRAPAGTADAVFADLVARHSAPGRFYHTLAHIAQMGKVLHRLCGAVRVKDATTVRLAVWFHDAVYDPRAVDNEARARRNLRREFEQLGGSA